jgi:hypothetical protein
MAVFDMRKVDKLLVIQDLESEYQKQNYVKEALGSLGCIYILENMSGDIPQITIFERTRKSNNQFI